MHAKSRVSGGEVPTNLSLLLLDQEEDEGGDEEAVAKNGEGAHDKPVVITIRVVNLDCEPDRTTMLVVLTCEWLIIHYP